MSNFEKIRGVIEAEIAEAETYEGIRRSKHYLVLAQTLRWYVDWCLDEVEQEGCNALKLANTLWGKEGDKYTEEEMKGFGFVLE